MKAKWPSEASIQWEERIAKLREEIAHISEANRQYSRGGKKPPGAPDQWINEPVAIALSPHAHAVARERGRNTPRHLNETSPAHVEGFVISNTNLSVRVCGVVVARLKVRREVQDGEYTGRNQILFQDPMIGWMPLDDGFVIELKRLDGPFEGRGWESTNLRGLEAKLYAAGAIPRF